MVVNLKLRVMKKLFLSLAVLAFGIFSFTSCQDDDVVNSEFPVMRDYQTDVQILSKFVDVNKSVGEYFLNENKKNSLMAYVSDADWQELLKVNPVNRDRFENELKALNSQLAVAAQDPDVSQIVYSTYGETWVREIDHESPVVLKVSENTSSVATRSTWARLQLLYGQEQWASFKAGKTIKSDISINMFGYAYYFFEIICDTNAEKSPSGDYPAGGGKDPKKIVMSGSTSMESYSFTWTCKDGSSNVSWEFRGKIHAPSTNCLITAEFKD